MGIDYQLPPQDGYRRFTGRVYNPPPAPGKDVWSLCFRRGGGSLRTPAFARSSLKSSCPRPDRRPVVETSRPADELPTPLTRDAPTRE